MTTAKRTAKLTIGFHTWPLEGRRAGLAERFVAGVREGPAASFYEDGQIACQGEFRLGVEHGVWTFFHPNGEVAHEIDFGARSATVVEDLRGQRRAA